MEPTARAVARVIETLSLRPLDVAAMETEHSEEYLARRAQQQLDLAAAASDPAIKKIHLDLAADYATRRERTAKGRNVRAETAD